MGCLTYGANLWVIYAFMGFSYAFMGFSYANLWVSLFAQFYISSEYLKVCNVFPFCGIPACVSVRDVPVFYGLGGFCRVAVHAHRSHGQQKHKKSVVAYAHRQQRHKKV